MEQSFDISVVIATRNRFDHLQSTIRSIEAQSFLPKEIIVVDASDVRREEKLTQGIPLKWIFAQPSVCAQRNTGIRAAISEWIFLCDDDIELEKSYLEKLVAHLRIDNSCGVVAGLLMQKEKGVWVKNYPVKSFQDLFWRFLFQHSIWGDIQVKSPKLLKPLQKFIMEFYKGRSNSISLAGWPLITDWQGLVVKTKFYSLGANLIRKDWLLQSPFDESLEEHGIGDNYGVAQKFPGEFNIHIVTSTAAYHHRASENRINQSRAKYLRIIALHYFLVKRKTNTKTKIFFVWSIIGHCLYSLIRDRKAAGGIFRALMNVVFKRNPYLKTKVTMI